MSKTTQKYLYLPLEIVVREHDGKTTLACAAAHEGWTVIIGPKLSLYAICDQLPEGVFLLKSVVPNELEQIKDLKRAGHKVCSLDEEGVVTYKEFLRSNVRFSADTVEELEYVFFWGDTQNQVFKETFPAAAPKGKVTGSPRFEFWRDYAQDVYGPVALQYREKYGNYILLSSSFGIANNILGRHQGVQLTKNQYGDSSKEMGKFLTGQGEQNLIAFKEYLDFLPDLAARFPETNFIIRPHPSESHAPWKELANEYPNIHFAYEKSATPWILGAAAVFHFKSTTSIEARIMGRTVVTYIPDCPPYMEKYELEVPLALSRVARTREDCIACLAEILADPQKSAGVMPMERPVSDWISVDSMRTSAIRILEYMNLCAPVPQKDLQAPRLSLRSRLRQILEGAFIHTIKKFGIISQMPTRIHDRASALAYGRHKYSGLDRTHTEAIIRTIEKKCKIKEPVQILEYTQDLTLIKKV